MRALPVAQSTDVAQARREAAEMARAAGMDEADRARVALVATELGTNLVKHAGHGELLFGPDPTTDEPCVEILALDQGPGMRDVDGCMVDGYSTAGTPGTGLGAVRRQATTLDIYSLQGKVTAVHVRIARARAGYVARERTPWAAVSRALAGEHVCGDAFAVREDADGFIALVADGLGHGPFAAEASGAATRIFGRSGERDADAIATALHHGLRPTRGAAVGVASVERPLRRVTYSGIGNIAGVLTGGGDTRRMVSNNGTAGHVAARIRGFQYPYARDALLVMHSDGLASTWSLDKFPGLAQRTPALVAGVLYREFGRARDDASILVARIGT